MAATNFDELVSAIAEEAPHAVVLDWYRRLELAIRAYLATRGLEFRDGPTAERIIAADPLLGPDAATSIAELRKVRNALTHGWEPYTTAEAMAFAREAFRLMGHVMRAEAAHAT
jgi:hypothetical protein